VPSPGRTPRGWVCAAANGSALCREHGSLAFMAHVIGEAEAQERQRDPAAFVLLPHQEQPVAAALDVVDVALAGPAGAGLPGDPWRGWRSGFPGVAQLLLHAFGEELLVEAGGGRTCGGMGWPGAGATLNRQVLGRVAQGTFVGIIYVLSSRARIGFVLLQGFISCQQDHYLLSIPRLNWVANP
jgi:hypothetical protein